MLTRETGRREPPLSYSFTLSPRVPFGDCPPERRDGGAWYSAPRGVARVAASRGAFFLVSGWSRYATLRYALRALIQSFMLDGVVTLRLRFVTLHLDAFTHYSYLVTLRYGA